MTLSIGQIKNKLHSIAEAGGQTYNQVQTLFFIECAALRLSQDPVLAKHLIFKGGFVSVKIYESPRFTTDLDATSHGISKADIERRIPSCISQKSGDGIWFSFEEIEATSHQGEYGGTRFVFRSGFDPQPQNLSKAQIINIDVGIGDPIVPAPILIESVSQLNDAKLRWQVYPPETIVAEKLHALVSLGSLNSRSKDVFDIHLLLIKVDPNLLKKSLKATFEFRKDELPASVYNIAVNIDATSLRLGWKSSIGFMENAPDFDATFKKILSWMKQNGI